MIIGTARKQKFAIALQRTFYNDRGRNYDVKNLQTLDDYILFRSSLFGKCQYKCIQINGDFFPHTLCTEFLNYGGTM